MRYEKEVFVINNFTLCLKKKIGEEGRIKINKKNFKNRGDKKRKERGKVNSFPKYCLVYKLEKKGKMYNTF